MAGPRTALLEADTASISCLPPRAGRQLDAHRFDSGSTTESCSGTSTPLSESSGVVGGVLAEACGEPLASFSSAQGIAASEAVVDVVQRRRLRIAQRRALVRERLLRAQPGSAGAWSEHLGGLCSSDCRECAEARSVASPSASEEPSGCGGPAARRARASYQANALQEQTPSPRRGGFFNWERFTFSPSAPPSPLLLLLLIPPPLPQPAKWRLRQ
ncbi:unnamed protein product [Prorocentrum cordatum]|uniref:Nuclear transcription factor Y subunit n=1 Tax=Prorocentrum cordatum TaxID=2364126 RepID=A0ABN9TX96_9DINO|nr:unnamed protein product [Polarella glacialis]